MALRCVYNTTTCPFLEDKHPDAGFTKSVRSALLIWEIDGKLTPILASVPCKEGPHRRPEEETSGRLLAAQKVQARAAWVQERQHSK
jgi:hypothetical protein